MLQKLRSAPNKMKIGQGPGAGTAGSKPRIDSKDVLDSINETLEATYEDPVVKQHQARLRRIADVCGC